MILLDNPWANFILSFVVAALIFWGFTTIYMGFHEKAHLQNCIYNTNTNNATSQITSFGFSGVTHCANSTETSRRVDAEIEGFGYQFAIVIPISVIIIMILLLK